MGSRLPLGEAAATLREGLTAHLRGPRLSVKCSFRVEGAVPGRARVGRGLVLLLSTDPRDRCAPIHSRVLLVPGGLCCFSKARLTLASSLSSIRSRQASAPPPFSSRQSDSALSSLAGPSLPPRLPLRPGLAARKLPAQCSPQRRPAGEEAWALGCSR